MISVVHFGDEKLKEAFEKLKDSKVEDKMLYEWIEVYNDDLDIDITGWKILTF